MEENETEGAFHFSYPFRSFRRWTWASNLMGSILHAADWGVSYCKFRTNVDAEKCDFCLSSSRRYFSSCWICLLSCNLFMKTQLDMHKRANLTIIQAYLPRKGAESVLQNAKRQWSIFLMSIILYFLPCIPRIPLPYSYSIFPVNFGSPFVAPLNQKNPCIKR